MTAQIRAGWLLLASLILMEKGSGDSSSHLSLSELKDMFLPDHGLGLSARPRRVSCQQSVSSLLLQDVISSSGAVLDYCYDTTEELWCQLTLKVRKFIRYSSCTCNCFQIF